MKTLRWLPGLILLCLSLSDNALAQSLREQLLQESSQKLAEDALAEGDVIRGAILFHQGNINCAKCHRPGADAARLGPDLGRLDPSATDEYIVESILRPSAKIKEGFEAVVVLTTDGRTHSGILVSDRNGDLQIRDRENVEHIIEIAATEVEEIRPGELSNMPEDLVDQLAGRQQFLDLLSYVFKIRHTGASAGPSSAHLPTRRSLSTEQEGLVLVQQLNCSACHALPFADSPVAPKMPPRLRWSAQHINPDYLWQFIADPHGTKPGTTMPDVWGTTDASERNASARSIVHYLLSEVDNQFRPAQPVPDQIRRGHDLFHTIGCVACHAPRDETSHEQPVGNDVPLGDISKKYDLRGLVQFLEDPLAVRPSGHMPNMQLQHREAIDLAQFMLQTPGEPSNPWVVDPQLARQGQQLFQALRCDHCHAAWNSTAPKPARKQDVSWTNLDRGCLGDSSGPWPSWHLAAKQRESVRAALRNADQLELDANGRIDVVLRAFNCLACHQRDGLGGVADERSRYFQTTNLNLGEQGRIPPILSRVGAKLKPEWMRDVLVHRRSVRPYMLTRMPQFGEENVGQLVALFESVDHLPPVEFAPSIDRQAMKKRGLELVGNRGLNCVACHTYKYKPSDTMPAVDLTEMAERLKKEWFYHYLLAPQKFSPNTVMPSYWPGGQAIRRDIEGTPEEQIEAIWQYLRDGRQAATPRGVIQEPLIVTVTDRTRILRRRYPGIGKRGIGVGYPGGCNLAFDAEQMRLGALWSGGFVDAVAVWSGQGSGNVRPLGRAVAFDAGPDLDDRDNPWIVNQGRPPNHRFRGYRLDAEQRPVFAYTYQDIAVEDYYREQPDSDAGARVLRRSVTITAPSDRTGLRFRIAWADRVKQIDATTFAVGDSLRVRITSDGAPAIVDVGDGQRLEMPLELVADVPLVLEWSYVFEK